MKIRTKLRIGTIITITLVIAFVGSIFFFTFTQQKLNHKRQIAEKISETSFQMSLLKSEYIFFPGERPKAQWLNTYEMHTRLLEEAESLFTSPTEREYFLKVRNASRDTRILFAQLVDTIERNKSQIVIDEIRNQLAQKAQIRVFNAQKLSEFSRIQTTHAVTWFSLFELILGLIVIGISVGVYRSSRNIAKSILKLGDGAKIIAVGNSTQTIDIRSEDEVGELAKVFNDMAKKIGISHHTLEQKVRERTTEVEKTMAFLDAIIENIPNMIFLKDAKDLRFVRLNKAGEELLGFPRADLLGKNDFDFFPKEQAEFFIAKDRDTLLKKQLVDIAEESIDTKFKGKKLLHTMKIPICDELGEPIYLLGISEDITERIRIEKTKSEFVSLASHQLRTPLTEIRWALSNISRESSFDTQTSEMLQGARKAVVNMTETIRSMLTISRFESGDLAPELSVVSLTALLQSVVDNLEHVRNMHEINLEKDFDSPIQVQTDELLFKEIITSLLTNAYKYTPSKGTVKLAVKITDSKVAITVQDSGCGIPLDEQVNIGKKFYRAKNAIKHEESGTGLGLYLAYSLTHTLGGQLTFASQEGNGTTFSLLLPYPNLTL